ncbi:MAG: hypothetical protein ACYS0I_01695 [Planctomycetota bacterium]|jgi:hypothetical protein
MIQECIEKNRDTIARWVKWMMIVGWVLLIIVPVILLLSVIQLSWAPSIWSSLSFSLVLRIIGPVFFGLLFLVLGQFLQYELGLEKQAGWFLRNGVIILRVYAAVIIGYIILQLAMSIVAIPPLSIQQFLWLANHYISWVVPSVAKVLLLWGAASMLKMMISGMRENTRLSV